MGVFWGMVELMRRVIPAEIVGGNAIKLRRMDGIVHLCYEITGTLGSFMATITLSYLGWGYSLALMPIGFIIAACSWIFIQPSESKLKQLEEIKKERESKKGSVVSELGSVFYAFFHSVWIGARLVCTQRALVWLIPAYSIALVHHRYLENTFFAFYAKSELKNSDLQSILVGGSNFGELLGAIFVVLFARSIKTPIPFLRADALLIAFVWIICLLPVESNTLAFAWKLAPIASVISLGWAAGDISLAAYIQSRLAKFETIDQYTSPLSAVMSFLYSLYLVLYFIFNLGMGFLRDDYMNNKKSTKELYIILGGVVMTVAGVVVFISTFIPRGSLAWNPDPDTVNFDEKIMLGDVVLEESDEIEEGKQKEEGSGEARMDDKALVGLVV
jgi:hypothetical protein